MRLEPSTITNTTGEKAWATESDHRRISGVHAWSDLLKAGFIDVLHVKQDILVSSCELAQGEMDEAGYTS